MATKAFFKAAKRLAERMAKVMLLASMVLGMLLASRVAWAATINCPDRAGNLCVGTDNRDFMYGTSAKDAMR